MAALPLAGVDEAEADGVDADAVGGQFPGEGLGEVEQSGAGGAGGDQARGGFAGEDGVEVDDGGGVGGAQQRQGGVQRVEDAVELQLQLVAPVSGGALGEGLHAGLAGVVDEAVEPAEAVLYAVDQAAYRLGVADVADGGVQPVVVAEGGQRFRAAAAGGDLRALVEEHTDGGASDARAAARDEDRAAGEA